MEKRILVIFMCAWPLAAAETAVELDPARTAITFTLHDVLHTVHGTFKLKRGQIAFDPATGSANGEIVIDVTSGASGGGTRDHRMHKEILESARFPDAIFTPDRVTGQLAPQGESQIDAHGIFQIHGASHEMTLHFKVQSRGDELTASTGFTIPYVQWGIKNPSNFLLKVSDKVDINVEAAGRLHSENAARTSIQP
jgi:polyisoprenoid-binding protein YceI